MIARFRLGGAVLLLCVSAAFAGGTYQTTKDGKTTVWNDQPKTGDVATWEGGRDREGYATGFGTLTWYVERHNRSTIFARYFGQMVRGKFEGPVNAHSKGKTAHAIFTEGSRTSPWARGPAPSRSLAGSRAEPTLPESASANAENAEPRKETRADRTRSETKAAKPAPAAPVVARKREEPVPSKVAAKTPVAASRSPEQMPPKPASKSQSKRGADDSIRSLAGPPSSLRTNPGADNAAAAATPETAPTPEAIPETTATPEANPPLSRDEVIDLADTVARVHGYNTAEFERSEAQHHESDDTWSLSYDQKAGEGTAEAGKRFSVVVDGKTKKASLVPGN